MSPCRCKACHEFYKYLLTLVDFIPDVSVSPPPLLKISQFFYSLHGSNIVGICMRLPLSKPIRVFTNTLGNIQTDVSGL